MIANCPSCGTHYKHELPKAMIRARCGRCDAAMDLTRLSPYRIVPAVASFSEPTGRAAGHLSHALDHPALAATIALDPIQLAPKLPSVRPPDIWEDEDPLPPIPEMTLVRAVPSSATPVEDGVAREASGKRAPEASPPAGGGAATFALWLATGAITGTGASWTMGGATMTGMATGATLGAVAGWGWLRWTSQK